MIPARMYELKKSFYRHLHVYESAKQQRNRSHLLLLFYAVECGLKVLVLKKIEKETTKYFQEHADLDDKLNGRNGHNIKYMVKFLEIPNVSLPKLPCKNKLNAEPGQYHEVWRYGIEADEQIEKEIEQSLRKLALKIKEVI